MMETLVFLAAVVLALPLTVGYAVLAGFHGRRRRWWDSPATAGASLALVAWPVVLLAWVARLVTMGSSTAVVAVVYGPLLASLAGLGLFLAAWSVGTLVRWPRPSPGGGPAWRPSRAESAGALAVLVLLGLAAAGGFVAWWPVQRVLAAGSAEELRSLAADPSVGSHRGAQRALAGDPQTPPDVLLALAQRSDPSLREARASWLELLGLGAPPEGGSALQRVASRPGAPVEALELLAAEPDPAVAAAVARNPATPAELLSRLARRPETAVQQAVASRPSAPPGTLERLADSPVPAVRRGVASNPAAGGEILRRLAADGAWEVRGAVALNPSTPAEALERLARDPDDRVRFYVATNPATPPAALEGLTDDPDEKVRRHAEQRLQSAPDA